ncbi:hypothetical protein L1D16_19360 [Vibrio sp. Isolate31]|uniref:hypothetical protein n=1 Tax=Vibrio sp. Isolate32 TaxID=2908538 RepID=UPI001EFDFBF3|nr:hypothetical protein [Vibrio sp. Isolate32]MCG9602917.1 hypothetical protein [Vibrio sp. Isolate31]
MTMMPKFSLRCLPFYDTYKSKLHIESFTISFAAAIFLRLLLKLSIGLEHKLADYFKSKPGTAPKIYRGLPSYVILVGSKFVMLEAISILFGDKVDFTSPWYGLVAFFAVVFTILVAEVMIRTSSFGHRVK